MEKLDIYLDQVCSGMGGPPDLRAHVRQELREHLLDAVAGHRVAGLTEADAVDKALAEFGKIDDVRGELEAAYGKRMIWILDKAMQWKEATMKAKWLWTTGAHLGLLLVIALEVLFITFNVLFIIPKFQKLLHDGIIDPGILEDPESAWIVHVLLDLKYYCGHSPTYLLIGAVVATGLFEWRVKSENKPFIRLSALGAVAVGLMVVIALMSGSLVVLFGLGAPPMGRMARPWAIEEVTKAESSINAIEEALKTKNWKVMQQKVEEASKALKALSVGPAMSALVTQNDRQPLDALRRHRSAAAGRVEELRQAIAAEDSDRLRQSLDAFQRDFAPLREAANRQP